MSSDLERAMMDAAFYTGLALLVYSYAGVGGAGAALFICALWLASKTGPEEDDDE